MNHTPNLQLPQWEASDRIHHEDFNDAFAAIDEAVAANTAAITRIATGSYVGDDTAERFIPLDFTPQAVLVARSDGMTAKDVTDLCCYGGLALRGEPCVIGSATAISTEEGGFKVYFHDQRYNYAFTNLSGWRYHYLAIG